MQTLALYNRSKVTHKGAAFQLDFMWDIPWVTITDGTHINSGHNLVRPMPPRAELNTLYYGRSFLWRLRAFRDQAIRCTIPE